MGGAAPAPRKSPRSAEAGGYCTQGSAREPQAEIPSTDRCPGRGTEPQASRRAREMRVTMTTTVPTAVFYGPGTLKCADNQVGTIVPAAQKRNGLSQMPLWGPRPSHLFGAARGRAAGGTTGRAWHRQRAGLLPRGLKQLSPQLWEPIVAGGAERGTIRSSQGSASRRGLGTRGLTSTGGWIHCPLAREAPRGV